MKYFGSLFGTMEPSNFDEVIDLIPTKISANMSDSFECQYKHEEVEVVLNHMKPGKNSGPDGMNLFFYQHY